MFGVDFIEHPPVVQRQVVSIGNSTAVEKGGEKFKFVESYIV